MKGLAEKFRAGPTQVNPALLSTAGDDRRDPAVALNLMSRLLSVSLATKGRDEPRRQHWPETRERVYEVVIRVLTSKRVNSLIIDSDSSNKVLQQTGPRHNSGTAGGNYATSVVAGTAFRICSNRLAMLSGFRLLWSIKKRSIVAGLPRCSLSRLGQRSKNSATIFEPISSNQSNT